MTDLLDVVPIKPPEGTKVIPIMVDFVVDPGSAPYLVSSSKDLLWVTEESLDEEKRIRAAVRLDKRTRGAIYLDVIEAIEDCSKEAEWGNVVAHTSKGIADAIEYLRSFGLTDLELLTSRTVLDLYKHKGVPVRPCAWLPDGLAVVVPKDRGFFGTLGKIGSTNRIVIAIHNPSRGIAICHDSAQGEE